MMNLYSIQIDSLNGKGYHNINSLHTQYSNPTLHLREKRSQTISTNLSLVFKLPVSIYTPEISRWQLLCSRKEILT